MNKPDICMSCMQPMNGFDVCAHCGWQRTNEQSDPCHLPMGTVLANRYVIGKSLGAGGFGITYVAWDDTLKQKIAVKEYYPAGLASRIPGEAEVVVFSGSKKDQYYGGLQRFLAEARNMAKFSSDPNIVNVIDFFEENHTAYIAMEYLDGITLKEYLKKCGGSLPLDVARQIIKPVSDALSHMHAQGIIHRDVSPDNIMITSQNVIKLIDFGAARLSLGEKEETLSVMLKPGFAPPEQYRTKSRQGPFTDVYALGATFYRMITGKMPPESTDRMLEDDMALPSSIDPSIPESVDRAILRAMALDYTVRFKSTDEFVNALMSGESVQVPEEVVRRRKTRNILLVLAAALAAIAGCAALFFVTRNRDVIKPVTLNVWIPFAAAEDGSNLYMPLIEEAKKAVTTEYSQITVEISEIPAEEYASKLHQAAASGNMPDVYALTVYDAKAIGGASIDTADSFIDGDPLLTSAAMPVSEAVADISGDLDGYYFLAEYTSDPGRKYLPTSFRLPILFANITGEVSEDAIRACENIADVNAYVSSIEKDWKISDQAANIIYEDCSEAEKALIDAHRISAGEADAYTPGEDPVYIGLSTDLKLRTATIKMLCVPGHEYCCSVSGMWCVANNADNNRARASKLMLVKLLNAGVQESISSATNCFPLKKDQCGNLMSYSRISLGKAGAEETAEVFMSKAKLR